MARSSSDQWRQALVGAEPIPADQGLTKGDLGSAGEELSPRRTHAQDKSISKQANRQTPKRTSKPARKQTNRAAEAVRETKEQEILKAVTAHGARPHRAYFAFRVSADLLERLENLEDAVLDTFHVRVRRSSLITEAIEFFTQNECALVPESAGTEPLATRLPQETLTLLHQTARKQRPRASASYVAASAVSQYLEQLLLALALDKQKSRDGKGS